MDGQPNIFELFVKEWITPLLQAYFSIMCMYLKCGGLSRDFTGSFMLDVFKGYFTPLNLGGSCTLDDISCNGR